MSVWAVGLCGFLLGSAVAAGQLVVDLAAWALVLPNRRRGALASQSQTPASGDPVGRPIEAVAADGVRLAGLWFPAGRSRGLVLLLHGFAEYPPPYGRARLLNAAGWDVAALDTRAHGRSGGDRGSFGGREGGDLGVWVDALRASGLAREGEGVRVWGRSMGAAVAVRAAAADPRFTDLVLEAPYVDLRATLTSIMRRKKLPMAAWFARRALRRARRLSGVSLDRPRPIDLAPAVGARVLVVHGTADTLIPVGDARRLAAAFPLAGPVVEVEGAGHGSVVETGGPPLEKRVLAFLDGD